MMRMVDTVCAACGAHAEALERNGRVEPCACGGQRDVIYTAAPTTPSSVHGDDIPGGITYKHGICNEDGTPRTFYTKHEVAEALEKNGLMPLEREIPVLDDEIAQNLARTGQSKRPLACSAVLSPADEAERLRHWHETERQLEAERASN